ncbi:MAG: 50S ribosomal protein L6 [Candidatus Moraniibacteriota bacterium]|nr:MAG: 50S ribosomal protein L6 [Candidatus Moranbacteria bacterium]
MSRIGQKIIEIPNGVTVEVAGADVKVKGSKGELMMPIHNAVAVEVVEEGVKINKKHNAKISQAMWGTTARLISNMITGVTEGFEKKLELNGVGYRMAVKGKTVDLALGFSHPVVVDIPEGLTVSIEGQIMTISGIDKQQVGQFAANVRAYRPVEPYKGKGFKYVGEYVRRKEGKKAVAA